MYSGFWELEQSRAITGNGLGSVPYSEVSAWLDENDIYDHLRPIIRLMFTAMDAVYLEHFRKKHKAQLDKQEAERKPNKARRRKKWQ